MTVFYCSKCGLALTGDLIALPSVPPAPEEAPRTRRKGLSHAPATIPRGHYAIDPESWGVPSAQWVGVTPWSAGPGDTVVLNPEDAPTLGYLPDGKNSSGCCGPYGNEGPNHACPCGVPLAILSADCMGPYELRLDPIRTYAFTP